MFSYYLLLYLIFTSHSNHKYDVNVKMYVNYKWFDNAMVKFIILLNLSIMLTIHYVTTIFEQ